MGTEFELKFKATAEQQAAIEALYGGFMSTNMESEYYDTLPGELALQRMVLRRRLENDRYICTCKAPMKDNARMEWEVECDDIRQAIEKLCKLGAPKMLKKLTAGSLCIYCGARFVRKHRLLEMEGATVELALDAGVFIGGGREKPLCEIEVELKSGSEEVALRFAEELAERFGLVVEPLSKFQQALL